MANLNFRVPDDLRDELEAEAEEKGYGTLSAYLRSIIQQRHESADAGDYEELEERIEELEQDLEDAETRAERLEREKLLILERERQTDALVEYVEAGFWGRLKKSIFDR